MSYRIDIMEDPDPVRVGATGTIGSLMFRELESMRKLEQKTNNIRRAPQNDAVSISCGRPLASLAGYRLGTRKQPPPPTQDSNARPRFYDSPVMRRSSNVEGGEWGRRSASGGKESKALRGGGFEPSTCRTRLGFGRQESLPSSEGRRHMDSKALQRKSVSLDGPSALSAFKGMAMFTDDDNPPATPGRPRKERNGEFRTPMLRPDGDEGFHGRRCGWKGVERRRPGGGDAPLCASMCSFVEVVDVNCNSTDKIWGSPIASRLRRLSFSRLSESLN